MNEALAKDGAFEPGEGAPLGQPQDNSQAHQGTPRTRSRFTKWSGYGHLREVLVIASAYFAYMVARKFILGDVAPAAFDNAFKVISFESALGIFHEPMWQDWAVHSARWLVVLFNWAYIVTFFPIIFLTALIFYVRDRPRYMFYRNIVLLSFAVALVIFVAFPLAPPFMMVQFDFVDTINVYGPALYHTTIREVGDSYNWVNVYAAMPSLHFGWTILFGVVYFFAKGPWWAQVVLKTLGLAYPTVTFLAIVFTGNHYIIDAVAGLGVAVISLASYAGLRRWYRSQYFPTPHLHPAAHYLSRMRLRWSGFLVQRRRRPGFSPQPSLGGDG